METEIKPTDIIQVFVTMKAQPDITLFDWLRLIEELNYAMDQAVGLENWNDFHIYGSSSDGFELLPQVCYQAKMTAEAFRGLREYITKQGDWLLPVGIYIVSGVMSL